MLCLTLLLVVRFGYIQIAKSDVYSRLSVNQRARSVYLGDYRGTIYDRNMIPLTERDSSHLAVIFPDMVRDKSKAAYDLSRVTDYDIASLKNMLGGTAFVLPAKQADESLEEDGIYLATIPSRYSDESIASHLIGYLNPSIHKGVYGIERAYDNVLNSGGQIEYVLFSGGNLKAIKGLGAQYAVVGVKRKAYGVKTTIDYHIQKIVEEAMDKYHIDGAAVVVDVKSGQILAMASRPNFSPLSITGYLRNGNGALINKAIAAYPLGSVFKTVVAAAAIEDHAVKEGEIFYCTGSVKVNGVSYPCYKSKTHGPVDMATAFAVSCNTTFIKIGQKVGGKSIIEMAKKFGFGRKEVGFAEESSGRIPGYKDVAGAGIGNLSIGQGVLAVTPLQVADMMATIADDGVRHIPTVLQGLVDEQGNWVRREGESKSYRVVSVSTAKELQRMLRGVVTEGTGKNAEIPQGSAGKTGTAETGIDGVSHGWFAGYVPYNEPRYSIVVLAEKGGEGGAKAAPVFKEIAENILKIR